MSKLTNEFTIGILDMFLHKQCDLARTKFAYDANTVWDAVYTAREALKELQHYKDLKEQGRLIEKKHGRWIHKDNFIGKYLMCSECSHVTGRKSNYCPNCGAKMDEVENERKID